MKRLLLISATLIALTGCGDRFRYTCQDPAKTNTPACQCNQEPRTKNKALGALEIPTTTIKKISGIDC